MIQELTVDNLIRLGLTETDANKLFNEDSYTLQCTAGNFYTSKAENRIYTGSDFWIFVYLTNNLSFPFQAPELTQEYFSLSLKNFLETKKEKLKSLYNEIFETQNFIKKETDFAKETILYWQNKKLTTKENLIDVLKGYLYFLENYKAKSDIKKVIELKDFFKHTTPLQLEKIKETFANYTGKDLAIVIYFLIERLKLNITKNSTTLGLKPFLKLFAKIEKNKFEAVRKCYDSASARNCDLLDKNNLHETGIENKIESIYKVG
jgi:hypothetical protein